MRDWRLDVVGGHARNVRLALRAIFLPLEIEVTARADTEHRIDVYRYKPQNLLYGVSGWRLMERKRVPFARGER
jgi:hypothetical protein